MIDPRPSDCPSRMRDEGKAYPRSCRHCGIYRCRHELPAVVSPPLVPTHRSVVAFTGLAGSGKSTAAARLVDRHGYTRIRFAGPLKAMMAALGLTPPEIEGDRKEVPCDLLGGKTPRFAMQTIGTEWGRDIIARDLWTRAWRAAVDKLPAGAPVVVDDCRFPNEAEAIRAVCGTIVHIQRDGAGAGAAGHSSEAQSLPFDYTWHNDGPVTALQEQCDELARNMEWARAALQP